MSFQKKTWKNRLVQYPLRRLLTIVRNFDATGTGIMDIQREDGEVTQEGDAFSAENMNGLEGRIESAFNDTQIAINKKLEKVSEMPLPVADLVGVQVMYVGESDTTYTKGYTYECQEKTIGTSTTYVWEHIGAGGGNFVGVRYHASLVDYPDYPCWEDMTADEKAKYDISTGATINFLDDEAIPDDILGDTDISGIADGTLTGAIDEHDTKIASLNNDLSNATTYSTTEKVVGTLDGALLYQKTYLGYKNFGDTNKKYIFDSSFSGELQFAYGIVLFDNGSRELLPYGEGNITIKITQYNTELYAYGTNTSSTHKGVMKIQVFYTK